MRRNSIYLSGALLLIAAATFPWDFQDHPHWYKVAWLPFVTGIVRPIDLLLNAALYFPIGFLSRCVRAAGTCFWRPSSRCGLGPPRTDPGVEPRAVPVHDRPGNERHREHRRRRGRHARRPAGMSLRTRLVGARAACVRLCGLRQLRAAAMAAHRLGRRVAPRRRNPGRAGVAPLQRRFLHQRSGVPADWVLRRRRDRAAIGLRA